MTVRFGLLLTSYQLSRIIVKGSNDIKERARKRLQSAPQASTNFFLFLFSGISIRNCSYASLPTRLIYVALSSSRASRRAPALDLMLVYLSDVSMAW
jgi:hypothetical protein